MNSIFPLRSIATTAWPNVFAVLTATAAALSHESVIDAMYVPPGESLCHREKRRNRSPSSSSIRFSARFSWARMRRAADCEMAFFSTFIPLSRKYRCLRRPRVLPIPTRRRRHPRSAIARSSSRMRQPRRRRARRHPGTGAHTGVPILLWSCFSPIFLLIVFCVLPSGMERIANRHHMVCRNRDDGRVFLLNCISCKVCESIARSISREPRRCGISPVFYLPAAIALYWLSARGSAEDV